MDARSRGAGAGREAGQVLPLVAVVLAAAVVAALVTVHLGEALAERARARNAADASALAGVEGGVAAARAMASANGAVLEGFRQLGGRTEVTVRVGHARATARAARDAALVKWPVPPTTDYGRASAMGL